MGDKLKKLEARARGKSAAATRAEKAGQPTRADNYRNQADKERERYMSMALKFMA